MNAPRDDHRVLLQRALTTVERLQTRLDAAERALVEPIAIIGMGCRFPGGVETPEAFWRLLHDGVDAVGEVPKDRWDVDAYFDPDPDAPGKSYTRWGGFLKDIDRFDAAFFGNSPREAVAMDPQHRMLLEVAWESLERAGQSPAELAGSRTGVFVGLTAMDYAYLQMRHGELRDLDLYFGTGNCHSQAAGRLSYVLDLRGPSVALDTACSSSLLAVHVACQSLRARECEMAIGGGANVMLCPDGSVATSRARMMSFTGRCHTFDAAADGYVRAEGCGLVVLKRLSDAVANGDTVLAVIHGTASNQDGRSNGLTAPNPQAQERVIRAALSEARIEPREVSYVEAHGTGTKLGDPIEMRALGAVFAPGRSAAQPLLVGSVKTNIGHTEAAAGIAGLIKIVLAMQHRTLPPHLHFVDRNPYIEWDRWPVVVPTRPTEWLPAGDGKRRVAGLSSFGFSGTNVHMVIAEPPPAPAAAAARPERSFRVLPLSAKSQSALGRLAQAYAEHLEASGPAELADVCFTAGAGRSHFGERLAVVADSTGAAVTALRDRQAGRSTDSATAGSWRSFEAPNVAFLFTGQGSQYAGMGRRTYELEPVFREALDRCDAMLRPLLERPLLEVLYPAAGADIALINQTGYTQPALFAFEYALCELWRSWGVTPNAVMGHSVGEYVAACVAGVFSLEDGLKLIAARGRLMQALPAGGTMVAVRASEEQALAALAAARSTASIAAVNGPRSVVISGAAGEVARAAALLEKEGATATPLTVSHAFHSSLMEPMLDEFRRVAAAVAFSRPTLDLVSNVTGALEDSAVTSPDYWVRHVRAPVKFARSVEALHQQGLRRFVEIGPAAVLIGMAAQCVETDPPLFIPSMRRDQDETRLLASAVATLYAHGTPIDWAGYDKPWPRRRLVQPTYPFERQRFWVSVGERRSSRAVARDDEHPLLGARVRTPSSSEVVFQRVVSAESPVLVDEHRLFDTAVMPAAAYVEMALAATLEIGEGPHELLDVSILAAMSLPEGTARLLHVSVAREEGGASFEIQSAPDGDAQGTWTLHATGRIARSVAPEPGGLDAIREARARCGTAMPPDAYYGALGGIGVSFGPTFQRITEIHRRDGEVVTKLAMPEANERAERFYRLHPAILDGCLQSLGIALPGATDEGEHDVYLPVAIERLRVHRIPSGEMWCVGRVVGPPAPLGKSVVTEFELFTADGEPIASGSGVHFQRASRAALLAERPAQSVAEWLYEVAWQERALPSSAEAPCDEWLVFADDKGAGAELARAVRERGGHATLVRPGTAFEREGDEIRVRPGVLEDVERVLSSSRGLVQVAYLWALDAKVPVAGSVLAGGVLERVGVVPLHLVQAIARRGVATARLLLVTETSQAVPGTADPCAVQAPLWGFARVVHAELPGLECRIVDLEAGVDATASGARLVEEARSREPGELQAAYREGTRYVPRLRRLEARGREPTALQIRGDAAYLVTGGLGGLGLVIARWLVERGAGTVVLFGRTAPSAEAEAAIDELCKTGATVTVVLGDVRERRDLERAIELGGRARLRGVIHAAGTLDDALLPAQSSASFSHVMGAKLEGAWNLHTLTENLDLDLFVMCSATASLFGSQGQANYAAANSFLDALSEVRRARGLPSLSVAWGAWAAVGMAARLGERERDRWARSGVALIDSPRGLVALERALESGAPYVAVIPIDWRAFGASTANPPRLVSELAVVPARERGGVTDVRAKLLQSPPAERESVLAGFLSEQVTKVFALAPSHRIDQSESLAALGMDSLMAMELRNRIQAALKSQVPVADLLAGLSIRELATRLLATIDLSSADGSTFAASLDGTELPIDAEASSAEMWEEGSL